jgi:cytosine/creatinine deaminase
MAADLLVRNVRPLGGDLADIVILAGNIAGGPAPSGVPVLEGDGRIALPGLVEAHTHLDKSLLGLPWYQNEVGPQLTDKIENERKVRKSLPIDPRRQSELQARLSVSHGTTFIRSHVDVDTECGVSGIEGVLATREALADIVDIDLVAFPQSGMLVRPGTGNCWNRRCGLAPRQWVGSTRARSIATRRATSIRCFAWPKSSGAAWISICTNPARWAHSRWS